MQFTTLTVVASAVIGASAVLNLTDVTFGGITVGKAFDITWGDASPPVTLTLRGGDPNDLANVEVIKSGLTGESGSFTWTPEKSLPKGNYAIMIQDAVTSNFGALFELIGATAAPSSTGSSATSASTTGSASTTATSASTTGSSSSASSTESSSSASKTSSTTHTTKTSSSPTSSNTQASATAKVNAAGGLSSPFALVFLGFAAVLFI